MDCLGKEVDEVIQLQDVSCKEKQGTQDENVVDWAEQYGVHYLYMLSP